MLLARLALERSELEGARYLTLEGADDLRRSGRIPTLARLAYPVAMLVLALGKHEPAVQLTAALEAYRGRTGIPFMPLARQDRDQVIIAARQALGDIAFAHTWEIGSAMTLTDAITSALSEIEDT